MGLFNWFFAKACRIVFDRVDHNRDGHLEPLEVEIAVLELYNIFNKRLPGWVDPPRRAEIQAALRKFDLNGNGALEPREFQEFAKTIIRHGPMMVLGRFGGKAALTTAILPALGFALHTSLPLTKRIPLAVLAPVLGNLAGVARMLFRL